MILLQFHSGDVCPEENPVLQSLSHACMCKSLSVCWYTFWYIPLRCQVQCTMSLTVLTITWPHQFWVSREKFNSPESENIIQIQGNLNNIILNNIRNKGAIC